MFEAKQYQDMYSAMFERDGRPIEILVNGEGAFVSYQVNAIVRKYEETELIDGGTIQLGDLRVMLLWDDVEALGVLGLDDRIIVDGRAYSVIHYDSYTRSVGETKVAVDLIIRGGGGA